MQNLSTLGAAMLSAALVLPAFSSGAVAAPAKCGDRAKLVKILKDQYKEMPVALGISQKSTEAFEIYTSESGTWTVVMTMSNGMACVMAAGHSWQDLPKQIAGSVT
ncbi:MAG: hypothetical protein ACR2O3_09295 [Rhizobiaceae bacterium]